MRRPIALTIAAILTVGLVATNSGSAGSTMVTKVQLKGPSPVEVGRRLPFSVQVLTNSPLHPPGTIDVTVEQVATGRTWTLAPQNYTGERLDLRGPRPPAPGKYRISVRFTPLNLQTMTDSSKTRTITARDRLR